MLYEKVNGAIMLSARCSDALAPIDFFAVSPTKTDIQLRFSPEIAGIYRHAKSHPGRRGHAIALRVKLRGGHIYKIPLSGGKFLGCTYEGGGKNFRVVRHWGYSGGAWIFNEGADKAARPVRRD